MNVNAAFNNAKVAGDGKKDDDATDEDINYTTVTGDDDSEAPG